MLPIGGISQAAGILGNVAGAFFPQITGKKPDVPDFVPIDIGKTQQQTIADNALAFESSSDLASDINSFNSEELTKYLRQAIPGYDQLVSGVSSNIGSMVKGEIPQDVQSRIERNAAYRSLAGGFAGSGMARNLEARDLGLTSLQLSQEGNNSAMRWLEAGRRLLSPQLYDATNMFLTPTQRYEMESMERDARFNQEWTKAQIDAAPDPRYTAMQDAFNSTVNQASGFDWKSLSGGGSGQETYKGSFNY